MIDQKALEAANKKLSGKFTPNELERLGIIKEIITAYEAAKPQLDQEALEIALDAAQRYLGYFHDSRNIIRAAIAKLRGEA